MPARYDSPLCQRCELCQDTSTHKLATCLWVVSGWNKLREILSNLEPDLIFESDHSILNLYFSLTRRENAILWLLGKYLELVEYETISNCRKISEGKLMGWLIAEKMDSKSLKMPELGFIPGLEREGIG